VIWRTVMAKVRARAGRLPDAERLASEAVALVEGTDLISHHADALIDRGRVLRVAGRSDEAWDAVTTGLRLYEAKGNVVGATRATALLRRWERETPCRSGPTSSA
jgi:hypothetical protein